MPRRRPAPLSEQGLILNDTFDKRQQPGGHVSASPAPTREELQRFYAELYYQTPQSASYSREYEPLELDYKRLKCDALLHAFADAGAPDGTFLDVGAGEGFLMHRAQAKGYDVTGIDFSSFAVGAFFPELSERLIAGDIYVTIEKLAADGRRFDACTLINVLEHVIDPAWLLDAIGKVLSPHGVLAITVPNDYSRLQTLLLREGFIESEFWFGPPQHLHYFNSENLPLFCESAGYAVVDAFSDFPIDLYLLHPGSNYVRDRQNGPPAHRARMLSDLLLAEAGLPKYLAFYRAMFAVGIGRDITVLLRRTAA